MESWWDFGQHAGYRTYDGLDMSRITCAFCLQSGMFATVHHEERTNSKSQTLNYDTLRCDNCGNLTMAFWGGGNGLHDVKTVPWPLRYDRFPESWPKDVGRYWLQAKQAQIGKNLDSAAVMARSALQLGLRHAGATGASLFKDIGQLADSGALPPLMKEWSHELRLLANESAHPELGGEPPSSQDVEDVISFLSLLLEYLFELPAQIAGYRQRRQGE
jgi:hypothetical protein